MLYFIVVWLLLGSLSWIIGIGVLNHLQAHQFNRGGDRLVVALWLGVLLLAVSLLATSLVTPLSPLVGFAAAAILCSSVLLMPNTRLEVWRGLAQVRKWWIGGGLVGAVGIAALMAQPVTWVDTGLYHYSLIQWLGRFGTVPGLALIFSNLGFSSSWFALAAPLNAAVFQARVSAVTNGFACLLLGLQLVICLRYILIGKSRLSDRFMAVFLSVLMLTVVNFKSLSVILVSPSPDMPILFLVGVIAWSLLVLVNTPKSPIPDNGFSEGVPLILAAAAVTLKLSALPLLLVVWLYFFYRLKVVGWNWKRIGLAISLSAGILSPLCIAGVIVSGCPLYPASAFCLNLPWSLPPQTIVSIAKSTHKWTTWYAPPPPSVPPWLAAMQYWLNLRSNQLLAFLIVISLVAGFLLWKHRHQSSEKGQIWVGVIAVTGPLFLFLTAPFFRFMLAYLLLLPTLAAVTLLEPRLISKRFRTLSKWKLSQQGKLMLSIAPLGATAFILTLYTQFHSPFNLLLPPPMQTSQVIQKQARDFIYFSPYDKSSPERFLCWDAPIPCGFSIPPEVRLRQPERGLRGGMIWAKPEHQGV